MTAPAPYAAAQDGTARALLLAALATANGCRAEAARALGVTRARFYREVRRLGLGREVRKAWPAHGHRRLD